MTAVKNNVRSYRLYTPSKRIRQHHLALNLSLLLNLLFLFATVVAVIASFIRRSYMHLYTYRHCVEYIKPTLLCASLKCVRYRQGLQACFQYVGKICMNGLCIHECIIYTTPINLGTVPRGINRRKMKSDYETHTVHGIMKRYLPNPKKLSP